MWDRSYWRCKIQCGCYFNYFWLLIFSRNILVDKPNDQSSRWSSESNYPPQVSVCNSTTALCILIHAGVFVLNPGCYYLRRCYVYWQPLWAALSQLNSGCECMIYLPFQLFICDLSRNAFFFFFAGEVSRFILDSRGRTGNNVTLWLD